MVIKRSLKHYLINLMHKKYALVFILRIFSGLNIEVKPGVYNTDWGCLRTTCSVWLPLKHLKVLHYTDGPICVTQSPHYKHVLARLDGYYDEGGWRDYIVRQHGASDFEARKSRFNNLIDQYRERNIQFSILVKLTNRGFVVLDGFHRLSITRALKRQSHIECFLASPSQKK